MVRANIFLYYFFIYLQTIYIIFNINKRNHIIILWLNISILIYFWFYSYLLRFFKANCQIFLSLWSIYLKNIIFLNFCITLYVYIYAFWHVMVVILIDESVFVYGKTIWSNWFCNFDKVSKLFSLKILNLFYAVFN